MSNIEQSNSFIDLKALGEPAVKLIESVSSAIGTLYEPRKLIREAKAQVEVEKIRALGKIDVEDAVRQRMIQRNSNVEFRRQQIRENITLQAISFLPETVSRDKPEEDWIFRFFDSCEDIGNEQMQTLWAKILAGEVAQPNTFSYRTLHFLKTMSKKDAQIFAIFRNYLWDSIPLKCSHHIFTEETFDYLQTVGFTLDDLSHLQSIGLVTPTLQHYNLDDKDPNMPLAYNKKMYKMQLRPPYKVGQFTYVEITELGRELAPICDFVADDLYITICKHSLIGTEVELVEK